MKRDILKTFVGRFVTFRLEGDNRQYVGFFEELGDDTATMRFRGQIQVYLISSIVSIGEGYKDSKEALNYKEDQQNE